MNTLILTFNDTIAAMRLHAMLALSFIALLWGIQVINFLLGYRLNILGIYPRHIFGLFGIACSPFLHASFTHVLFNSIPLFFLASLVASLGKHIFFTVSLYIIAIGGVGVWIFGRKGLHVGASGLIMGYLAFLLTQAYFSHSPFGLVVGLLTLYYCGSLLLNLIPTEVRTSFEGHIFGFAAGIASYWLIY